MYYLTNCTVLKKLKYFKDLLNILIQPTVTTLSEFCMSALSGGSGASSLVEISTAATLAAPLRCGVGFGVSTFIFSAETDKTQIYVELQSPREDGPSVSEMRTAPGYTSQVNLGS